MLNLRDIIGGRYHIIDKLGRGAFGQTYLAKDRNCPNQTLCVVKQLKPLNQEILQEAKHRFFQETETLKLLGKHHPQIPKLLDNFEENGEFYLVQEFVEGEDLKRELYRKKYLTEIEVIAFLQDSLKTLQFVHGRGIIHRDIKPSNLMRRQQDNKIILIDFGAVKEIGSLSVNSQGQTIATRIIGTQGYMPPEQVGRHPKLNSDIYALGRTGIQALTGKSPVELEDTTTRELCRWQEKTQVSQKLATILDKMVHSNPDEGYRYQSVQEVLYDLKPLLKIDQIVGGRYKVKSYLGGSIWGYTYLAENVLQSNHKICIIKQLKSKNKSQTTSPAILREAERRFKTELKVLKVLGNHDQIPDFLDEFEENEEFYLVQEFIYGKDLSQELQEEVNLSEEQVISLLQDVLNVLTFIHEQGVIHRDIKPSNLIRRNSDGKILLIDFGIVKEIVHLSTDSSRHSSTHSVGTNGYMPPEQASGRPVFASDIYALGMTVIQALTGMTPEQIEQNPKTGNLLWNQTTQVNPKLANILNKMVQLDLGRRYKSATEVLKKLKTINNKGQSKRLLFKSRFKRQPKKLLSKSWFNPILNTFLILGVFILMLYIWELREIYSQFRQGDFKLSSKEYKSAIGYYDAGLNSKIPFVKNFMNFEKALLKKAFAFNQLGRYNDTLKTCEEAILKYKNSVHPLICKGTALEKLDEEKKAIDAYKKAIEIDPSFFEAWNNLGNVNLKLGDLKEARENFDTALEFAGEKAYVTRNDIGKLHYELKNYEGAVQSYLKAIKIKKDYISAWIGLATARVALEEHEKAIEAYNQAIELAPDSVEAWYGKCLAHKALKQNREAIRACRYAIIHGRGHEPSEKLLEQLENE